MGIILNTTKVCIKEVYLMDIIKNWFKENGYEIEECYETRLQAKTDTVLFLVVKPHSGTK